MEEASKTPRRATVGTTTTSNAPPPKRHKRSLSGSLLSSFTFLKPKERPSDISESAYEDGNSDTAAQDAIPRRSNAMAAAVRQHKGRPRKGSLRKTALLGGGRKRSNTAESKRTITSPRAQQVDGPADDFNVSDEVRQAAEEVTVGRHSYETIRPSPTEQTLPTIQPWPALTTGALALNTAMTEPQSDQSISTMSPITSPISNPYISTTDDDESITFSNPVTSSLAAAPSSFSQVHRRRSSHKAHPLRSSPLARPPSIFVDDEWDYSETENWGWFILVMTWIVFVVGMGSCLGVWSWAWDVGETPYAPPELEDDPTLPIVGYYPALIILTAVMAWVWVVVAWVGMKYFRHAKVVGEDG